MDDGLHGRTLREFQSTADVWGIVEGWAREAGYRQVGADKSARLYQKGKNLMVAPLMLQVTWTGGYYRLEAWVRVPTINRVFSLGMLPPEMIVDSGGFRGIIPREKARADVNSLLLMLGVPPIA